jgi:hypothetical protein
MTSTTFDIFSDIDVIEYHVYRKSKYKNPKENPNDLHECNPFFLHILLYTWVKISVVTHHSKKILSLLRNGKGISCISKEKS